MSRNSRDAELLAKYVELGKKNEALVQRLNANDDDAIDDALARVNDCVALKTHQHAFSKEKYPTVFQ